MEYIEVKKQLKKKVYTQKPYSIYRIPGSVLRIRIISAVILILLAVYCSVYEQHYLYAFIAVSYAAGLVFTGYLRGVFFALVPIIIKTVTQRDFFYNNIYLLFIFFLILFIFILKTYNRIFRSYYTQILNYNKDGKSIEFENAINDYVPVTNFTKCIKVDIDNDIEGVPAEANYKLINAAVSAVTDIGKRNGFIFAGSIASGDYRCLSVYFYTTPRNVSLTSSFINKYFERFAKLTISSEVKEDGQWEIYKNDLLPDEYERLEIYNENYIEYLEDKKIDLTRKYKLLYRFKAGTKDKLPDLAEKLIEMGYSLFPLSSLDLVWEDGNRMFIVYMYGRVGECKMNLVTKEMFDIASEYNVEYCDWVLSGEEHD